MLFFGKMFNKTLLLLLFIASISFAGETLTDSKVQGRLNIINGASAECVMHKFYTNSGWTQINGAIGRNGIDGLYYKEQGNVIKEVLVAESKWNTSNLGFSGKGKTVKQMSQEWVLRTLNKLVKKIDTQVYRTIRNFIEHDQYRARLVRLKPVGKNGIQMTIYRVKNKGLKVFETIKDTQLPPIDITAPKNSFESGIVAAYNDCRRKYLKKYLPILEDAEISLLLQDNYIQKNDVLRFTKKN
jgi:hypothetical protein